jgi:hypothetical protein
MDAKQVFSYTKVKGIEIGEVVNVAYDKHNDTIIVIEDKGLRIGSVHHTFGSKAEGLIELIDALQCFHQKKFAEKEETFNKIREVIKA